MSWVEKLRSNPWMVLFVCSFALFQEEFLYGMVCPLTPEAPAHISDEHVISTLYGAYALGMFVATPILGLVTDRLGRRRPMIIGGVLLGIAAVLFAIGTSREMLYVGRVFQGAGAACSWTAGLALVAKYCSKHRVRDMGYCMLGATTGSVAGPWVGGELFDKFGYLAPFYFAIALVVIDTTLRIVFTPSTTNPDAQPPWSETFKELRGIALDKRVLSAAFAVALAAASWALMEPLFPMHAIRIANASPATVGGIITGSNLLYAFLAPVVAIVSDKIGVRTTTALGLGMTAVFLPLLALTPNLFFAGSVLWLITISYAFTINPTSAELGDAVDHRGSSSYSVAYAVYNLAYAIGMISVDSYVEFVTDSAHHLQLLHILLIVSGLFALCLPLFLVKPQSPTNTAATDTPETAPDTATG
ncbi:MAG TPA: MFS transporter [Candidatus Melainabacteria bacterium]|nr:MFS transporter [Candidatus Melainabacteria bacterium]HIN63024.1 MFS transporter [Candidatus Obscuribacterales bacterium]